MFLKHKLSGNLVEVLTLDRLYNPGSDDVEGRLHAGEEMQDPEVYPKSDLIFPSGETLPQCWVDMNYRGQKVPVGHVHYSGVHLS
ncbi:MAG: acetyltransferase [Cyanobacteria bacterium SID2]|nr:acetyltransferase [Cyanobacteria bacterium SID2]MBP0004692.1 acetyltransferase [Cyanobacteria bacterium SBC]